MCLLTDTFQLYLAKTYVYPQAYVGSVLSAACLCKCLDVFKLFLLKGRPNGSLSPSNRKCVDRCCGRNPSSSISAIRGVVSVKINPLVTYIEPACAYFGDSIYRNTTLTFPATRGMVCRKCAVSPCFSLLRRAPIASARCKARALPVGPRAWTSSPAFSWRVW
jgi:hypothetical protein